MALFQTLEEVLVAVLRHPTLEGWFLALERQALPPHALSPVLVKLLAASLSSGILPLLVASAPALRSLGQLGLLARYSKAITQSVLRELHSLRASSATSTPKTLLPPLEALRGLHPYMEDAPLREVTLALLSLPEARLAAQRPTQHPRKERPLTALGRTLVQLLSGRAQEQPQSGEPLWASEYVRGLAALLPALAVAELDAVLLGALQRELALVPAVRLALLDDCLARRTPAALATAALLLQHSWPHRLRFERWCQQAGSGLCLREAPDDFLPIVHVYLQGRTQGCFTRPAEGTGRGGWGQLGGPCLFLPVCPPLSPGASHSRVRFSSVSPLVSAPAPELAPSYPEEAGAVAVATGGQGRSSCIWVSLGGEGSLG